MRESRSLRPRQAPAVDSLNLPLVPRSSTARVLAPELAQRRDQVGVAVTSYRLRRQAKRDGLRAGRVGLRDVEGRHGAERRCACTPPCWDGQFHGMRVVGEETVAATSPQAGRRPAARRGRQLGPRRGLRLRRLGDGGIGGSLGWADPERGLALAYATTRMGDYDRALAFDQCGAARRARRSGY